MYFVCDNIIFSSVQKLIEEYLIIPASYIQDVTRASEILPETLNLASTMNYV